MREIVILHVFRDEKFFDSVADFFDSLKGVRNIYALYSYTKSVSFKYIKNIERVDVYTDYKQYVSLFSSPEIQIIYFQSLPPMYYKWFKYIGKDKLVFWWCFGYEIYSSISFLSPLINIDLYKPLTKKYQKKYILKDLVLKIYQTIKYPYYSLFRAKIINRIDYFTPVLPDEYYLLKDRCSYFKAKPFALYGGPGIEKHAEYSYHENSGNILLGNSLTYTNNHLDILKKLQDCDIDNFRKIYVPMSYGNAYKCGRDLKKFVLNRSFSFVWLDSFLPYEQYVEMFSSITHAVFGVVRQQSMGNIFICLSRGIKVFLYKDSIVYRYLKNKGYTVFTIDEDLNTLGLNSILSYQESRNNYELAFPKNTDKKEKYEKDLADVLSGKLIR